MVVVAGRSGCDFCFSRSKFVPKISCTNAKYNGERCQYCRRGNKIGDRGRYEPVDEPSFPAPNLGRRFTLCYSHTCEHIFLSEDIKAVERTILILSNISNVVTFTQSASIAIWTNRLSASSGLCWYKTSLSYKLDEKKFVLFWKNPILGHTDDSTLFEMYVN